MAPQSSTARRLFRTMTCDNRDLLSSNARRFVGRWRLPSPLRRVGLPLFRTWVAGQAIDLDDARALVLGLPLREVSVRRLPGTPGLVMEGGRTA